MPIYRRLATFFVVIVFVAMQWAPTHIHLQDHHEHDSAQYIHAVKIHSHEKANGHDSLINEFHQVSHAAIIEVNDDAVTSCVKCFKIYSLSESDWSRLKLSFAKLATQPVIKDSFRPENPSYSSIHPRAPPKVS